MIDIAPLYPPTPEAVPSDLTRPPRSYLARVVVVFCSLMLFLAIYLALTIGTAYLSYACFAELLRKEPPSPNSANTRQIRTSSQQPATPARTAPTETKPVFWLVVGGVAFALIFLFMVKGFFKGSRTDPGVRVEVTEAGQPVLFAFIRRLCHDTGAPFPHQVFVVPDVNAAVSYHESVLNLFLPARKNLIIGLGLVNRLTLTEFKAVLAHEFGHFSQKSMKLGSYVYTANRVVSDVVYGRDWLDDLVANATRIDIRIAVFAWGFQGILWCLRKGLAGLFRMINFANASLSRQMEYNADLVAASVTGSDALVFSLARLDFAGESLGQAWADLAAAADHGRFSRDLYFHQTRAADYLRMRRGNPALGTVPALPDDPSQSVQVFKPEDVSVPRMWATHPSNHDREVNLKQRYFRGAVDDRPAWELFANAVEVKEAVTRKVYQLAKLNPPKTLEEPETVQAFIDAEHAETTYDPRYHGFYDNRYIQPGDPAEILDEATSTEYANPAKLAFLHTSLYGEELEQQMEMHKARLDELARLSRLTHGAVELRGRDFEFRGSRYQLTDAPQLLKSVQEELDKDYKQMHLLDRLVFRVYHAMAVQLGDADRQALDERYRFHLAIQNVHGMLTSQMGSIQVTLAGLAGRRQVGQNEFQNALSVLRHARKVLSKQLGEADELKLPPLTNMTAGEPLGRFLFPGKLIKPLSANTSTLDGNWINEFMAQLSQVIDKSQRLLFKSLGGLLMLQQDIAARWKAAQEAGPGVPIAEVVPGPGPT